MVRKAKRESKRQMAAEETSTRKVEEARWAAKALRAQNAGVVAIFAKRARDAAIVQGATMEEAEAAAHVTSTDAENVLSQTTTMTEFNSESALKIIQIQGNKTTGVGRHDDKHQGQDARRS
jgi:hypothetical protein